MTTHLIGLFRASKNKMKQILPMNKVFNPSYPNISMYILHTALCTFSKVLKRGDFLTIKSLSSGKSFPNYTCDPYLRFRGGTLCLS